MNQVAAASRYLDLVREFPLRPIRTDAEHEAALERLVSLLPPVRMEPLAEEEEDYRDVLASLIHEYEAATDPLPEIGGIQALKLLMEDQGLTLRALADQIDIPFTTLGAITSGKRQITPRVREALAKRFKMHPSVFV